jgi:hypothetical protein
MPKNRLSEVPRLASLWSPPAETPIGAAGQPLVCVASTYTFHAPFFEGDLLPRFLGLRFDDTEGIRPFIVEREEKLAIARAAVLVDGSHVDPSQTTLRWDQLPVRVPGAQHSKVVVLAWENLVRFIVSSANVTRSGYRRNREIAGVFEVFNHETSAPRRLGLDVLDFLDDVVTWVQAPEGALSRLRASIGDVRTRLRAWRNMPSEFRPREMPRAVFVAGLPRKAGGVARSPLRQLVELWGARKAKEVVVMTPFVGDLSGDVDPVVERLLDLPRSGDSQSRLVVPGQPSERDPNLMVVGLPRRFLEAWASAWRVPPEGVPTYVVPVCRAGEKANRDLHAKGIVVTDGDITMLLCGSSNFSPRGMGVGVANIEANLCYVDEADTKHAGLRLMDRLPVHWDKDLAHEPFWPTEVETLEDEQEGGAPPIPPVFSWAALNQQTSQLTLAFDLRHPFPPSWAIRWPGEAPEQVPALVDHGRVKEIPEDGRYLLEVPKPIRDVTVTTLRVSWRDDDGRDWSGALALQVQSVDDLLPPEEFRSLTAQAILDCLLSGREPAEWVESEERRRVAGRREAYAPVDSLNAIDTRGFLLYRTRRLGTALAAMGERLRRTVPSRDAVAYRLRQDPLGPRSLAAALVREWEADGQSPDASAPVFGLSEISLMLAYAGCRLGDPRLKGLFREMIAELHGCAAGLEDRFPLPANIRLYFEQAREKCAEVIGGENGTNHAG